MATIIATIASFWKTERNQAVSAFMVGVFVFYILNAIFNIILPVFMHITNLYFIGDYSTTFLLAATTFAILRHKLFDIKVFATEILTFGTWVTLLIRIFLYPGSLTQTFIDLGIFLLTVFFGILVIRSVRIEVEQKEKLAVLTKALQALDNKKDEFINMAAHELRAPLTAIKGFLSMVIGGDTGPISDQAKGFLNDTAVSTERMIRLVNNMLNVSRIEEGRMVYQEEDVHIGATAQGVYDEFKVEAERRALEYKLVMPEGTKDLVFVDEDKLHEVIVNFVSNAIKYTEKGMVTISVINREPGKVRVEVKDTGAGISKEEQKKLFQKFYRVEAKVGKTIGTGLGLYISKLLVQKFGGTIGVTSKEGVGSTFWFELPVNATASV
jgi:signal transduction histidine kinase